MTSLRRALAILGSILLLALIVLAVYAFVVPHGSAEIDRRLNALTLDASLKDATFLTHSPAGVAGSRYTGATYETAFAYGTSTISFVRGETLVARVDYDETSKLYSVRIGGKVATSTPYVATGIGISPDARHVAYAQRREIDPSAPRSLGTGSFLAEPGDYDIVVIEVATGAGSLISNGVSPVFLDDNRLAWAAEGGIVVMDLATRAQELLIPSALSSVRIPLLLSPDRRLLAVRVRGESVTVYRLEGVRVYDVAVYALMPRGPLTLGNDGLYQIRLTDGESQVWRYPLLDNAEPKKIHTLPRTLPATGLILSL